MITLAYPLLKQPKPIRRLPISLPRMAVPASLLLLLVGLYILPQSSWRTTEIVPNEQLAPTQGFRCTLGLNEEDNAVISVNVRQQLSFAIPFKKELQAAAIKQLAAQHNVVLTSSELIALKSLPFLATDVEYLPHFLGLPIQEQNRLIQSGQLRPLSKDQLMECVAAIPGLTTALAKAPVYFRLRVGANVKSSQVMTLLHSMQTQHINCFNLVTQEV